MDPGETQSASPSTGAKSTVKSNPDAMTLRNCIVCLYTRYQIEICDFNHLLLNWMFLLVDSVR